MNEVTSVLIKDPSGDYELIADIDILTLTIEPNGFVDDKKADIHRVGVGNRFIVVSKDDYDSLAAYKRCVSVHDLANVRLGKVLDKTRADILATP